MQNSALQTSALQTSDFGIYVMTYPGDFHLSTVLVRSIQALSPGIPIAIIPGDDFDLDDHPFDVPVLPRPAGFLGELGHKDRSFWAFHGPFERFLYLDADTLCVKSLDALAKRVLGESGDFILVQPWARGQEWPEAVRDPAHPKHAAYLEEVKSEVGRGPLERFDPGHDFLARRPFNTGIFASRRGLFSESDLQNLHEAERKFYREVLKKEWSWAAKDLFFYDQGRMNYLAGKLGVRLAPLKPELVFRPGSAAVEIDPADVAAGRPDFHIVHWMGAKSPSASLFSSGPLFKLHARLWSAVGRSTGRWVDAEYPRNRECVGYSLWRLHHDREFGRPRLADRLRRSGKDAAATFRLLRRWIRLARRGSETPARPRVAASASRPPARG